MSTTLESKVTAVTVLEDRASVTRRGSCSLPAGQHRLIVERVAPVLADKTLLATATGGRVLDIRCERYLAPWRDPDAGSTETITELRAERTRLEQERDAADARVHAARVEIDGLASVLDAALHDLAIAAARGTSIASPGSAGARSDATRRAEEIDAARELAELDRLDAEARQRSVDAELAVASLCGALDRLADRIADAEAQAGETAARLVIDVVVASAGGDSPSDVALDISYVVPGAAWRPYHRAILAAASGGTAKLEWQTTACIWQATGEDWTDVALTCSLERSSLGVEPPELRDDELRTRRRADSVVVESREHVQMTAGLGSEVPGIDDGGIGMTLQAKAATIRADGKPHRIAVGGFTGQAQLSLVAIPLRSPWVHHRARIVNTGSVPLLAGPVDLVMSSGYVGRAEVGFVAAGEKFYLGFGPEAEVRVHRDEDRDRDEAGLLGGWNTQTVKIAVRLSNLGGTKREIVVTERIPISEVEQVQVEAAPADAYLLDQEPGGEEITQVTARALDERGLVTWSVELPPFGRRAVTLQYKLKSQRGVSGL